MAAWLDVAAWFDYVAFYAAIVALLVGLHHWRQRVQRRGGHALRAGRSVHESKRLGTARRNKPSAPRRR